MDTLFFPLGLVHERPIRKRSGEETRPPCGGLALCQCGDQSSRVASWPVTDSADAAMGAGRSHLVVIS